ncbi:MAG: hypothetical protein LLG04_02280 [Parachlamydia sp.]|nr:hypothetical protein [Parachlamydia sp.]
MKINSKVLNIPPFISTSWDKIASLHMKGPTLAVVLSNGETILVPGLAPSTVELIFAAHANYLETEQSSPDMPSGNLFMQAFAGGEEGGDLPVRFGFSSLDGMGGALQHDPSQSEAPPLPDEVLSKIAAISKIVASDEAVRFPQAHPGCNCMHCQICRAISGETPSTIEVEPEVSVEELQFKDWEITQVGDKLYEVVNPLDRLEKYNVYLGDPVGCNCGRPGCEHILAVLKS